jgi:endonuclease-3
MAEKISVRKTRRLRRLLAQHYELPEPPPPQQSTMEDLMMAIVWNEAPAERARLAYENLTEEFVDWNELRVSLTAEVAGVLESCGLSGEKAPALKRVLGKATEKFFSYNFDQLRELPRQKLTAWFLDIEGLPHPLLAAMLYWVFDYDRVLVGEDIARVIRRLGLVSEDAAPKAIEPALNDVVPAKEAHFAYRALRQHALEVCTEDDPRCTECPLQEECNFGKARLAELKAAEEEKKKKTAAKKTKTTKKTGKKTTKKTPKKTTKKAATKTSKKASKKKPAAKRASKSRSKKSGTSSKKSSKSSKTSKSAAEKKSSSSSRKKKS